MAYRNGNSLAHPQTEVGSLATWVDDAVVGALADLAAFGDIAEAADEAGLGGMLIWDHVLSPV